MTGVSGACTTSVHRGRQKQHNMKFPCSSFKQIKYNMLISQV